jgi:excisionase family DNA binding protein
MNDDLMTIREAAKRLGLSHSTLSRQIRDGKIPRRADGKVSLAAVEAARRRYVRLPTRAEPGEPLLDPRFVGAAWRNSQGTTGRDEVWREHFSQFAAQHAPALAAELGVRQGALHHALLLHVYSHIAALLPGYSDPLAGEGEP